MGHRHGPESPGRLSRSCSALCSVENCWCRCWNGAATWRQIEPRLCRSDSHLRCEDILPTLPLWVTAATYGCGLGLCPSEDLTSDFWQNYCKICKMWRLIPWFPSAGLGTFSSNLFIVTAPFIVSELLISPSSVTLPSWLDALHQNTVALVEIDFFSPPLSLKIIVGNLHTEYLPLCKLASGDKESRGMCKFYVTRGPQGRQSGEWKYIIIHNESCCCVSVAGLWLIFHVGNWMYCSGEGWLISFITVPTKQKYNAWMQK